MLSDSAFIGARRTRNERRRVGPAVVPFDGGANDEAGEDEDEEESMSSG